MISTPRWWLSAVVVAAMLLACTGHDVRPIGKIAEMSRTDFFRALRWKQYPAAAHFMAPEFRQEFIDRFSAFRDDLHISDVRLVNLQTSEDGRRFETTVEMDYTLLPSIQLKTFVFDQTWVDQYGEGNTGQGFQIVTPFPEFP